MIFFITFAKKIVMVEKTYFIVKGIQKKQDRDSNGHFLSKKIKYITKTCPKVLYSNDISKAKLFGSHEKAKYALYGINMISEMRYDFDVVRVKVTFREN